MGLPNLAVRRPVFTVIVFSGIVMLGIISLVNLQVELYQNMSRGIISITTRARGGLAPFEVETLITKPVEEAVATVSKLKNLFSNSREGESKVTLQFEPGTNMDFAALEVREKFSKVKNKLPEEIEKPVIANFNDSDSPILIYSIVSNEKTPEELREYVDRNIKPKLARVNGVASVEVYGGRERKILIELDRDRMFAQNLSIEKVMETVGSSNVNLLAGELAVGTLDQSIRTIGGFTDIKDIGEIGIGTTKEGSIVPLKEVGTIKDSYSEPNDYARLNQQDNCSVQIKKTSTANTIQVSKSVKALIDALRSELSSDIKISIITDRAETILRAIGEVEEAMLLGVILTVITIFIFLKKIRLALVVMLSIPTAVIATFIFMASLGISINVMTLTGLALATGMLVDSSIVVIENIFKKRQEGMHHIEAVITGAAEVWLPLAASCATTIIVFLPIIFIDKEIQLMYQGLAFTISTSLISSLFVAVMLIPMLLSRMRFESGNGEEEIKKMESSKFFTGYRKLLKLAFDNKGIVLLTVFLLFIYSAQQIAKKDMDLPSAYEENEFSVVVFPISGAELGANDRVAKILENMLHQFPEVKTANTVVRKDDLRIYIQLVPKNKRKHAKGEIIQYIREKGGEEAKAVHEDYSVIVDEGVSGDETTKLVVDIYGVENDKLEKLAHEFSAKMGQIQGLGNIVMTDLRKRPEYSLVVDRGRAAIYGLTVKDIADSIHAQVRGMRPTKYHEKEKGEEIETITRLQPIYREKLEDLRNIFITNKEGDQIPLSQVASFYPSTGPSTIDRKDKHRYVFVKADTSGAIETAAKRVREAVKDVQFPKDYYYRFGGRYPELVKGRGQLSQAMGVTVLLIYMLLACLFQSFVQPLFIMVAVPLASIGVWAGLTITHKPLSQSVFIGMIMLSGTVVNSSIILIDRINMLREHYPDIQKLLMRACQDRLRPIMMTTISTLLGFLPMAMSLGQSSELWSPLAITVMGGLISSTLLTLFIIPCIFCTVHDCQIFIKKLRTGEIHPLHIVTDAVNGIKRFIAAVLPHKKPLPEPPNSN
ncbi:MAG: efflux RND transporter permease subunit [Candidatus Omnitrophica bacterium]|nr:efflux RND transporter permease subunit [Candidatus Omnitrophota bacterium]